MKVRKTVSILLVSCLLPILCAAAKAPDISAAAGAIADVQTGRILYSKNGTKRMEMASTTKVMTAILAIESGRLQEVVTIDEEASGVEGSSLYLEVGEQFTLEDLVYGLMLRSGNDAAVAIAGFISGSVQDFAALMNEKAREIGAVDTNFVNPHGLPHSNHYTTAKDLAKITAYALRNDTFATISSAQYKEIVPQGQGTRRSLQNKNKMLWTYEGATGVKTGYTTQAGKCLVASAAQENMHVAAVVLRCGDMWEDAAQLLDYAFAAYDYTDLLYEGEYIATLPVENGIEDRVEVFARSGFGMALSEAELQEVQIIPQLPAAVKAPIRAGQEVGTVQIYRKEQLVATVPVVCRQDVGENTFFYRVRLIMLQMIGL